MLRNEVITEIQKEEYKAICKRISPIHYKDLYQEFCLIILQLSDEKLSEFADLNRFRFYSVGVLRNMAHSSTSEFYKKYRRLMPVPDEVNAGDSSDNSEVINKLLREFNKQSDFEKRLAEVYLEEGSFRKVEEKYNIHHRYTQRAVKRMFDRIKNNMKPIRVLLIGNEYNGLYFHRQLVPHARLQKTHTNVQVTSLMGHESDGKKYEGSIDGMSDDDLSKFDIVYYLRQITFRPGGTEATVNRLKGLGIKVVLDIDDYWVLPQYHLMKQSYKDGLAQETVKGLEMADHVVTTTDFFAEQIKPHNQNITVIPNCIHPEDGQFKQVEIPNSRLRFGWIGGVHHAHDIKAIETNFCKLHKDKEVRDQYQICLGGFNVIYTYEGLKPNPEYKAIETSMTCNYEFKHYDSTYNEYLNANTRLAEHITFDKSYRRLWAKGVDSYGELYNDIDVALVPLLENKFSGCKSELKLVEAGWMGKAVIVSDVSPYSKWIQDGVNGIKVKPSRNGIDWYIAMKKLIKNRDIVKELGLNLQKTIKEHFDLDKHNERRYELYQKLIS